MALIVLTLTRPITEKYGFLFGGDSGRDVVLDRRRRRDHRLANRRQLGPEAGQGSGRRGGRRSWRRHDYVTLIRAGSQPQLLYRGYLTEDKELLDKIDAIEPDIATTDLAAALAEALSDSPHGPRVIYIISDHAAPQLAAAGRSSRGRAQLGHDVQLVVMNVGSDEPVENLALLGEPPRAQRPIVDLPVLLAAKVAASQRDQPVSTRVSVVLDDQVVGQLNLTMQPGRPATAALAITPKKAGILRGRFELPPDAFPDDNTY